MKHFEINLGKENVKLAGYLHDLSEELKNAAIRPAVLIFPGGGYFTCSDREAEPIALAYMAEGYQTFVLRYSVGKDIPFQESYEDAIAALTYVKENSEKLRVDSEHIALVGFSAGGHLAAAVGTMSMVKPSAMILGYPVILDATGELIGKEIPGLDKAVTEQTPPAFIFSTSNDMIVPIENSLKFAAALNEKDVPFEMHIFSDGPHGLSLAKPLTSNGQKNMVNPSAAKWFEFSISWLKSMWGDFFAEDTDELEMKKNGISINTPVRLLMEETQCSKILEKYIPDIKEMLAANPMSGQFSVIIMNHYSPEIITDEMLKAIERELEQISK